MNQAENITSVNFARELTKLMDRNKTTQTRVASASGVSQPAVVKWLKGNTVPQGETLMKLARFFDVLPEQLLQGEAIPGSLSAKWRRENPSSPGAMRGPSVPIIPHPLYREIGHLSGEMTELRGRIEGQLATLSATMGKLDEIQARVGELMEMAANLDSIPASDPARVAAREAVSRKRGHSDDTERGGSRISAA